MGIMPQKPKDIPTLAEAWGIYRRDWLEANGKSFYHEEGLMNGHLKMLRDIPLNAISTHDLDRIIGEMTLKGCAAQTIRLAIGLVSRIMRRMITWRLYSGPLPFDGLVLPKLNNSRSRFLSPDEARSLLAEIKSRSFQRWLMSLISLHSGLRFGEIARLCWSDIDFEGMDIHVREAKSGYGRHAVMTGEVASALSELQSKKNSRVLT